MATYTFDQKLFRTVYVQAHSLREAREILEGLAKPPIEGAGCLGDCRIVYGEECEDGTADFVEVTKDGQ